MRTFFEKLFDCEDHKFYFERLCSMELKRDKSVKKKLLSICL